MGNDADFCHSDAQRKNLWADFTLHLAGFGRVALLDNLSRE
jgi:hypothetical protein